MIQNDSEIQQAQPFNLSIIYNQITKFYNEIIEIEFESNFFNPKDNSVENFRKLAELMAGVAAKCENNEYFLQIMQNMQEATEMFNILSERISAYVKINDFRQKSSDSEEDNVDNGPLYLRIERLTLENDKLNEEVKNLKNKISDLTKDNYNYELTIKELETKYQDLLESRNSEHSYSNDYEENVNLSIQIFELKGKLEAKDKHLQSVKDSKERAIEEYSNKISMLQKENETLKDKSRKYDVLKEKYEKSQNEDYQKIKQKLYQSEKIIKDQEEKLKKLKNFDVDKSTLLNKIQELNYELSQDREKLLEYSKENNYYKETVVNLESDLKFYKNQCEFLNSNQQNGEIIVKDEEKNFSLKELEDLSNLKKHIVELDTKFKIANNEKETLEKEKTEIEASYNKTLKELETTKTQLSQFSKKVAKYLKFKEDKENFLHKISDLMEKNLELKGEIENLKFLKGKEKTETESYYNNIVSNLNKKHNEEIFSVREISNKLENENNFLKKEIKKNEELIESNKLYIEELQRKIYNPHSETKIVELEAKLKEISSSENLDLKKKVGEREDMIVKLSDKIKILESKTKEIEKFKKLSEEINDELLKKDEALTHFKNQLESKEKLYKEEQQLVSSLFHQLALQFNILQSKLAGDDKEFTWLVNNFQTMNMSTNYNK